MKRNLKKGSLLILRKIWFPNKHKPGFFAPCTHEPALNSADGPDFSAFEQVWRNLFDSDIAARRGPDVFILWPLHAKLLCDIISRKSHAWNRLRKNDVAEADEKTADRQAPVCGRKTISLQVSRMTQMNGGITVKTLFTGNSGPPIKGAHSKQASERRNF